MEPSRLPGGRLLEDGGHEAGGLVTRGAEQGADARGRGCAACAAVALFDLPAEDAEAVEERGRHRKARDFRTLAGHGGVGQVLHAIGIGRAAHARDEHGDAEAQQAVEVLKPANRSIARLRMEGLLRSGTRRQ